MCNPKAKEKLFAAVSLVSFYELLIPMITYIIIPNLSTSMLLHTAELSLENYWSQFDLFPFIHSLSMRTFFLLCSLATYILDCFCFQPCNTFYLSLFCSMQYYTVFWWHHFIAALCLQFVVVACLLLLPFIHTALQCFYLFMVIFQIRQAKWNVQKNLSRKFLNWNLMPLGCSAQATKQQSNQATSQPTKMLRHPLALILWRVTSEESHRREESLPSRY